MIMEGARPKFNLVLTGNLVEYDYTKIEKNVPKKEAISVEINPEVVSLTKDIKNLQIKKKESVSDDEDDYGIEKLSKSKRKVTNTG
jgi:hypothetical protein